MITDMIKDNYDIISYISYDFLFQISYTNTHTIIIKKV